MQNPFFSPTKPSNSNYFPFDRLETAHFAPAFEKGIEEARAALGKIASDSGSPDFANTIEAIEFHRETLDEVSTIFFNLNSAHTNDEIQKLAKEISPKLSELSNDLLLNEAIFKRVKAVWESRDTFKRSGEQQMLLEKTYKAFRRNGALLDKAGKEKLREIDRKLARLTQEYSDRVLKATNGYKLVVKDRNELKGLPEFALEAAKEAAKEKGEEGYLFTLHVPSYLPLMQFCEKEELRNEIWLAYMSKGTKGETDNKPILKEIADLRFERARLLGYETHAHFVLEERMAANPDTVEKFLNDIVAASRPAAEKDVEELKALKKELGFRGEFQPWDTAYFSERLQERKFDLKEEELRPYFQLENVIQGVFEHARRLYGLVFEPRHDVPVYHPDVKAYSVKDERSGDFVGLFYADFFPRASKKSGAWMTSFREQGKVNGGEKLRPHVSIVCNFTKPTSTQPSLLSFDEVRTLFHEFGHALHGLLSECEYVSLGGTNVYWDFVELPSQIMENWTTEEEALKLFARHYKSGEAIPHELVEKIKKAAKFQAGYMSLRQMNFAVLDMAWHARDPRGVIDVEAFEHEQTRDTSFFPMPSGALISTSFSHIFAGGYSSGYYSYKWAEVLDADAFEFFKEKGIFNPEVAKKFRENVLSKGGSEHPMTLYKRFRGREPDPKALLRRDGLIS